MPRTSRRSSTWTAGPGEQRHDPVDQAGGGAARRRAAGAGEVRELQLGAVLERGEFTVTADYFRVDLDDRLAVTQDFALTPEEVAALRRVGHHQRGEPAELPLLHQRLRDPTQGIDVVATYSAAVRRQHRPHLPSTTTHRGHALQPGHADRRPHPAARGRPAGNALAPDRHASTGDRWRLLARVSTYSGWYDADDGRAYDGGNFLFDAEVAYTVQGCADVVAGRTEHLQPLSGGEPGRARGRRATSTASTRRSASTAASGTAGSTTASSRTLGSVCLLWAAQPDRQTSDAAFQLLVLTDVHNDRLIPQPGKELRTFRRARCHQQPVAAE